MRVLLLLFLITIGVNWPELPYNARLADLLFIPLAVAVIAMGAARLTWRRADLAVAIYLFGAIPAIVVSPDQRQSSMEFLREIYLVAIYVVFAIAVRHGFAKTTGQGLAAGGAILSIAGLVFVARQLIGAAPSPLMGEVMPLPYIGNALRLRALTASEAMLACVLTAAAPFAIALCRPVLSERPVDDIGRTRVEGSDRARSWCVMAGVMTMAALLTFSHAIAGFAVAVLLAAWPSLAAAPRLRRFAIAGVAIIFLGLNVAATVSLRSISFGDVGYADSSQYHHAVDSQQTRIGGAAVTYDVMSYARIKQVAWRAFVEHPVAGIGLDQFHSATRRAYDEGALPSLYREIDPHSTLLGRLAECGIIGGLTLLLLWVAWAVMARDVVRGGTVLGYAAAAALAGLIVSSLNADIMNFRFVWVLAGLLRGLQETNGMVTASGRVASTGDGAR